MPVSRGFPGDRELDARKKTPWRSSSPRSASSPPSTVAVVREGIFFDAAERVRRVRSARPAFYPFAAVRRPEASTERLERQALSAGVEIRYATPCRELPPSADRRERAVPETTPSTSDTSSRPDQADGVYGAFADRLPRAVTLICSSPAAGERSRPVSSRSFRVPTRVSRRTVEFFRRKVGLRMSGPRRFGGNGQRALAARCAPGRGPVRGRGGRIPGRSVGIRDPFGDRVGSSGGEGPRRRATPGIRPPSGGIASAVSSRRRSANRRFRAGSAIPASNLLLRRNRARGRPGVFAEVVCAVLVEEALRLLSGRADDAGRYTGRGRIGRRR